MKTILVLAGVLMLGGCSHRAVYENLQMHTREECRRAPPPEYDRCMRQAQQSFDEYERERRDTGGD